MILSKTGSTSTYVHVTGIIAKNKDQCFLTVIDITDRNCEKALIENQRLVVIGEMASSIAHDFNNSLQAIFGNLEPLMIGAELTKSTLSYLKTIRTIASDAADRVQQLQHFSGTKRNKKLI